MTEIEELKIRILADGIRIDDNTQVELNKKIGGPLSLFDYCTTQGVILRFTDSNIFVNADFLFDYCKKSLVKLCFDNGNLVVSYRGENYPVDVYPVPSYFDKQNAKGSTYSKLIATHGDRARISPIVGCSFGCQFCDFPLIKYTKTDIEDMLDAINVAVSDNQLPAKHLLISGGTPKVEDRPWLIDVFKTITRESPIPVDVMVAAWIDKKLIADFKKWGVNELSINVEIWDQAIASKLIVGKNKLSRNVYIEMLKEAVKVFGRGKVRCMLLVGLEPLESTLEGIKELSEIGVSPVLSPFRPAPDTLLKNHPRPTYKDLLYIWNESKKIAAKYKIKLGPNCIPCAHNTLTIPDNSDFYHYN